MTQYLLSVHSPGDAAAQMADLDNLPPEVQAQVEAVDRFNTELQASGAWVFAGGLDVASTATVVDGTGDAVTMTDGPYAETKEVLGGFWIIDVPDLDAALTWAAQASAACANPVEVRPFQAEPEA